MSIASEISRINQNIAAAYTACSEKGATLPVAQNSAHLADTIDSITGGSTELPERKDVNFFDYDGTLLYSYSVAQAAALTSLPALPSHDGLLCQGWNYTLAQIQTLADGVDIGCTYTTDDGSTKLYCYIPAGTKLKQLKICLTMEPDESAEIYWGDGTSSVVSNPASTSGRVVGIKNDYTEASDNLTLCIRIVGGRFMLGGAGITVFGEPPTTISAVPLLKSAHIGSNCIGIYSCAFQYCYSLTHLTIPSGVTSIGNQAFDNCVSLASVLFPVTVTSIGSNAFSNCNSLLSVSLPMNVTNIGDGAFRDCNNLVSICVPAGSVNNGINHFQGCKSAQTAVVHRNMQIPPDGLFMECSSLTKVSLPESLTAISTNMFRMNYKLYRVVVPGSVTSIGVLAFYNCRALMIVDMTAFTDPDRIPALCGAYADVFGQLNGKIYVANNEMLTAFRNATNWSTVPEGKFAIKEASV